MELVKQQSDSNKPQKNKYGQRLRMVKVNTGYKTTNLKNLG